MKKTSNIKEKGNFNNNGDYVSSNPYLLIHSPATQQPTEENSIWIHLYKEETNEKQEVVSTNMDSAGNYIRLTSGQTTNVLMDISDNGNIKIYIAVTPWDEIYQWSEH
ncbi:MAG: hypothetical protein LIO65_06600 [Odoribacter sp.]|nr:hypothetical protein [Odoribacter sp.]